MLQLEQIDVGYDAEVLVLKHVSLSLAPGELVAIIGPNGAGKSTVLKTVLGYLAPSTGTVLLDGQDITGWSTHDVVRGGVGYVPQGRIVFPDMTVLENLEMGGYRLIRERRDLKRRLELAFSLFPRLADRRAQRAGTMSGGEQQMLAIARALMSDPKVMLLDEPSLGLSPAFVEMVFEKITELKIIEGMTMLMVEQNAARALEMADRGYVLELGRNRFTGTGTELSRDPEVKALYLGGATTR